MNKFFLTITFFKIFLLAIVFVSNVLAETDIGANVEEGDGVSVDVQTSSMQPEKILVTQLKTEHNFLTSDTESWMRLLHYYSVTRLGFSDIPFNYIIDRQGNVYEGMDVSQGFVSHVNSEEGIILVGYFSQSSDITLPVQQALSNLIEKYSYRYGIPRSDVQAVNLELPEFEQDENPLFNYILADDLFADRFNEAVQNLKYSNQGNIVFTANVSSLNYENSLNIGERLKVDLILENKDDFAWYIPEGLVFLSTVDSVESMFAINQVWDSFSKPFSLSPQVVSVGESIELSFEIGAESIIPGKYTEAFEFVLIPDRKVEGSKFEIEFEVLRGNTNIVEIQRTSTGGLTVYDCPRFNCQMVAAAKSGDRHVVLEEDGDWYRISVDGVEGWVTANYARKVE